MFVPEGLSEQDVMDCMTKAANEQCRNYQYGYNDLDDFRQQAIMHCIKVINAKKFVPKPDKDIKKQLLAFLRVHVRNRLSNDRRKESFRYSNPESRNNKPKYAIMHPLKIHSFGLENSEIFARDNHICDEFDKKELFEKIRDNLTIAELKDLLKLQADVKISEGRKIALIERIREILEEA